MRTVTSVITFVLLAGAAVGQVTAPPGIQSQLKPDERCTLEGSVVDSNTGQPVMGVTVEIYNARRGGRHSVMSDDRGHFVLNDVEAGAYFMGASGSSYPYQTYGQQGSGKPGKLISLAPGEVEKDLVFRLAPGAVITGTVYNEDGDPVIGANVLGIAKGRQMSSVAAGPTNDKGEYRIYGLEAGRYLVMVDYHVQNGSAKDMYLPTFYPGTADEGEASTLDLQPGDEAVAINVIMTKTHGMRVRGRVMIEGVAKPKGSYVYLTPQMTDDGSSSRSYGGHYGGPVLDNNGDFQINSVPNGSYIAYSNWSDGKNDFAGHTPVEVNDVDVDDLAVVLKPAFTLHGRVRTESGAHLNLDQLTILLEPTDNQMMGAGSAQVATDGTFVFRNLFEENYLVNVGGHPEEFYLKSASLGGSEVLDSGLSLNDTQLGATLEIELSQNGGTLSGTVVHDQKPVPGVIVTLVPDAPNRKRTHLYAFKFADQFGRFNMGGLPPGDYKVFAWDSISSVDVQDPEFLKTHEDRGQSVHIEEKHRQSIQLELITLKNEPN